MITSKEIIEREARKAAADGKTPGEACRWPFTSPGGEHFKAVYMLQPGNAIEAARCIPPTAPLASTSHV